MAGIEYKDDALHLDKLEVGGVVIESIDNPEWLDVKTDKDGKFYEGTRKDGMKVFPGGIEGIDEEIQNVVNTTIGNQFINKSTIDKFSEGDGHLLWNGSPIEGDGITQEEADERYASKSVESEVASQTTEIEDIKDSLDVNPPAVVALRNEIDQTEARVDNIESQMGITPPVLSGYKKIASETIITQVELNSWEGCVVEIIADIKFNGSTNYTLKSNCVLFFNGGKFISDNYTGTLNLNGAYVKAEPYNLFDTSIATFGNMKADICYAEWFGAIGNGEHYDAACFQYANDIVRANELHLVGGKTYLFERTLCMRDVVIRGSKNSKIIRNPVCADVPVFTNLSNGLQPDNNGLLSISVDTTSSDYLKLKIGMEVNFVNAGIWDNWRNITFSGYIIEDINGSSIKLRGLDVKNIKSLTGATPYSIISSYPLILGYGKFQLQNVHIDGGLNAFTSALENGRISWWYGGTINTVAPEGPLFEIVIENCLIENCLDNAIECAGNQIVIQHNRILHTGCNGIVFSRCNGAIIRDNYIFDTNLYPKTGHNEGAVSYSDCCYNILIDGNYFDNCLTGIGSMDTGDNAKSIITNNIFSSFRTHGIDIDMWPSARAGNIYSECIINNNKFIPTHEFQESVLEPHYVDPIIPLHERQLYASGYGINVHGHDATVVAETLIISDNIFKDCGIFLDSTNDAVVSGNNFCIKHEYSLEEKHPNTIIRLANNCVANVIGNVLRNYSDTSLSSIIESAWVKRVNVASNMYSKISGVFIVKGGDTDLTEELNNIEIV